MNLEIYMFIKHLNDTLIADQPILNHIVANL